MCPVLLSGPQATREKRGWPRRGSEGDGGGDPGHYSEKVTNFLQVFPGLALEDLPPRETESLSSWGWDSWAGRMPCVQDSLRDTGEETV